MIMGANRPNSCNKMTKGVDLVAELEGERLERTRRVGSVGCVS